MAILSNLLVNGESRLLGKLYTNDIEIGGIVNAEGGLHVGKNTAANANIYLNNKLAMRGIDTWLRINDTKAFTNGVYFGSSLIRTDGTLQVGSSGSALNVTSAAATIAVPATFSYTANANGNVGLKVNGTATITTGNITTANTNNIYNTGNIYNKNGRIETDVIRSNVWDIVSTQNLGGSFIVAPTIMIKDGSTVTITSVSGTTIVGSIKDTTNITSDSFGGHTWSQNSKIKITGKLTSGNNHYVLGTCDGTLTAKMNTTSNTINFSVTCNASTLPPNGTYTITGGTVMMYNVGGSNLVGIELTSYGTDKYTYIDIYNGSNGIKPVSRLGKLDNLSTATYGNIKVNGDNLTGYGIYTNNGFFEGKIVSSSGKIGGFNIGTSAIYSTTNALGTTDNNVYIGTEGISLGTTFKVTKGGVITATSGTIGNFTLGTAIYSGTNSISSTTAGVYLGTDGVRNYKDANTYVNISNGVITAKAVDLTGKITASSGSIAGWRIESTYLASGTSTAPAANVLFLSPSGTSSSYTIAGQAKTGWMITAGTTFGVNKDGGIYATSGKIGGWTIDSTKIYSGTHSTWNSTAEDGLYLGNDGIAGGSGGIWYLWKDGSAKIGAMTLSAAGVLEVPAANITGTLSADRIATGSLSIGKFNSTDQAAIKNETIYNNKFYQYSKNIVVYGDSNKYYPVYFKNDCTLYDQNTPHRIFIYRGYAEQAPNDWNTSTHKGGLTLGIIWNYGGWGGATYNCEVTDWNEMYSTILGDIQVGIGSGMTSAIFLRGGGTDGALYHILCDVKIDVTHYNGTFPAIGNNENVNTDYMYTGDYHWKYASPLTAPNTAHIKSLMAKNTASAYITDIDSNNGITIKPLNTGGNDYLQMNSTAIEFYRNNSSKLLIDDSKIQIKNGTTVYSQFNADSIKFYDGNYTTNVSSTNEQNYITAQFSSSGAVIGKTSSNHVLLSGTQLQLKNNGTVLADFGSTITLGQTTGDGLSIDTDGLKLYRNGKNIAEFGENIRLGVPLYSKNSTYTVVDNDGLKQYRFYANLACYESSNYFEYGEEGDDYDYIKTDVIIRTLPIHFEGYIDENKIKEVKLTADMGSINSGSKTVNVTSNNVDTYVEGATITLKAGGVYIIHAYASFPSNSTETIRRVQIYNKTASSALRTDSNYGRYYVTGDIMDIFKIDGATDQTYCTRVSAGVAISNVATYIKAVRIV